MEKLKDLHNIKKSIRGLKRHQKYILGSFKNFDRYYHISNQPLALKLYIESRKNKKNLPKNDRTPFSNSTSALLVPNMRCKTKVVDLAELSHYIYGDLSKEQIKELAYCGRNLKYAMGHDKNGERHHKLLNFKSAFCDFKYCPNRQHHNAKLRSKAIYTQLRYLYDKYNWTPIFITLTMPSIIPTPAKVRKAIQKLTRAWKNMATSPRYNGDNRKNKANKGILKGWIEKVEHTYCDKPYATAYGRLHYHLHVIGLVHKSYFKSNYYVKQSQWLKDWRTQMDDPSIKAVSVEAPYYKDRKTGKKITIRNAKSKKQRKKITKHAADEIAKYTGKATDYGKLPKLHRKLNRQNLNQKAKNLDDSQAISQSQLNGVKAHYFKKHNKKISNDKARDLFQNLTYQTPSNRLKHNRKYLVKKSLNSRQLKSVSAFHSVIVGEKNQKLIRFGGWCSWSNKLYKAGSLKKYEPEEDRPEVIYDFKIISKYSYKYHDYEDYKAKFSSDDLEILKNSNCKVNPVILHKSNSILENYRKKENAVMDSLISDCGGM